MVRDCMSRLGTWGRPRSTPRVCSIPRMDGKSHPSVLSPSRFRSLRRSAPSLTLARRFVTVCGDGEYIIYTALAWRNKAFGSGTSFAWASDSNTYAVQEGKSKIKAYKNFKERPGHIKTTGTWAVEGVHGGPLLSARGNGFVMFWDWESGSVVRRIEVDATNVSWSSTGALVAIMAEDSYYVLRFDRDAYQSRVDAGEVLGDEGVEEAFELVAEVSEP